MPELPEVETIVQSLRSVLAGQLVLSARVLAQRVVRGAGLDALQGAEGGRIEAIERRGKHIVLTLDCGLLLVHLGMTGKLLWNAPRSAYTRAVFELEQGVLAYEDIRMFGRLEFAATLPERVAALGPEPLEIALVEFRARLKKHQTRIKPLLLNQRFVRGVGNIYADEALFRAGIHPRAVASKLSAVRASRLWETIREVLQTAIAHRGSSISNYVDSEGRKGGFQTLHLVYAAKAVHARNAALRFGGL